ncbi:MAG TPA: beta-ketoacyl-ACP synthase III [Egibacteraceae bacterium]|nr:beta-ketoacyl-ACP synthase III [Egibacteraceae bacterium]
MTRAVVEGLGTCVPPRVVTNEELAARLDTSDEWVRTRTGIAQRHVADPGTATADLAVEAGARALKSAGGGDVDAVIVATTTPDRVCPSTAPEVAARLGLPQVAAFDVAGACAGFVYGLATGSGLLAVGAASRVLLIGAETMTRMIDPDDRTTAVLFGDGAGAVVLRPASADDEPGSVGPFDLGSDGDLAELLVVPAGGSRRPADAASYAAGDHYLRMDGREVYRQAVRRMVDSSRAVLDRAGLAVTDVDRLVGHQANARILDAVADRLGVPAERRVVNVARYGNTSAASIPLALADLDLEPGQRVLLTAFGAGLTWGSTILTWPDLSAA